MTQSAPNTSRKRFVEILIPKSTRLRWIRKTKATEMIDALLPLRSRPRPRKTNRKNFNVAELPCANQRRLVLKATTNIARDNIIPACVEEGQIEFILPLSQGCWMNLTPKISMALNWIIRRPPNVVINPAKTKKINRLNKPFILRYQISKKRAGYSEVDRIEKIFTFPGCQIKFN